MNCADCEQLFDAYLDGQLAGSLRLEFDAHRLRCQRCQQTLAMLETIGDVIAADAQMPDLSTDFTDQVMARIERPRRRLRLPLRAAVVGVAALQAAAVLLIVLLMNTESTPQTTPDSAAAPPTTVAELARLGELDRNEQAIMQLITTQVEDRLWDMHTAQANLTTDLVHVARYLNITLPDETLRQSEKIADVHPLQGLMNALVPNSTEKPEPTVTTEDVHSI